MHIVLSSHFREHRAILSTSGMADGNVDLAESGRQQHQQQEQQQQLEHGTEVEVLSESTGSWFLGKVVEPKHQGKVTIQYMMPSGCTCRKHLPIGSGHVRVVPKDHHVCDVVDPTGTGKCATMEIKLDDGVVGRTSVSFGRQMLGLSGRWTPQVCSIASTVS